MLTFPVAIQPLSEAEPNDTVDVAQDLGDLSIATAAGASGKVGNGSAASDDVDWYHFVLDSPARVRLATGPRADGATFQGVIGLYNEDPFDFADRLDPLGHRLLAQRQADAPGGLAQVDAVLAPGSYDVAVSGAGNRFFHPLLAGSGYDGSTGDYNLLVTASAVDATQPGPGDGPAVLSFDPQPGAILGSPPQVIRVALGASLDPGTVIAGQTVQLLTNPGGTFGDGNDRAVDLASVNYSAAANELQVFPSRALSPGSYQVILAGDSNSGNPVLASPSGIPLGADSAFPGGQDALLTFRVDVDPGASSATDTPATARDLGDLSSAGLVQAEGVIGNDPFFDATSPDPARNPGNGVDLYHFRIAGPGRFAFLAEVFAQRIGSPLDPGVALYRLDPSSQALVFVAGNNNTGDASAATDGSTPLSSDAALFAGLTAGDYYVAVSSGSNTPSPLEGQPTDTPGLYDPLRSHSGELGFSTGPYALNILVRPAGDPPHVVATGLGDSATLDAPPTELTVRFNEPVSLQQLSYQVYQSTAQDALPAVYILGADGTKYFPRFESFDGATNTAKFLMLDALPNGTNELHLSGTNGLTDYAGQPLVGNNLSGDYVTRFEVDGPVRGDHGDPLTRTADSTAAGPQDLGVIFPHEWQAGVHLTRDYTDDPTRAPADVEDGYRFQVLQRQVYSFLIAGTGLDSASSPLSLTDVAGNPVDFGAQGDGSIILADLAPGTYVLHVGPWNVAQSPSVVYEVTLGILAIGANPTPLVDGPSPALQLRLNALPGSGSSDPTTPPVEPAPTSTPTPTPTSSGVPPPTLPSVSPGAPAESSGVVSPSSATAVAFGPSPGLDSPASVGALSSSSMTVASGLSIVDAGAASPGAPASSPGSASSAGSSVSSPSVPLTPNGLVVLGIVPVGGLSGGASAPALASASVAFSLPSQTSSAPSLGESIVQMITATQALGGNEPLGPIESIVEEPVGEVSGPALVFDVALKQMFDAPPDAGTVVSLDQGSADAPATQGGPEPVVSVEVSIAVGERSSREEAGGDASGETGGVVRLATLGWGAAIATLGSGLILLIKRYRARRIAPPHSDRSTRYDAPSTPGPPGLSRTKSKRARRFLLSRIARGSRASSGKQGTST